MIASSKPKPGRGVSLIFTLTAPVGEGGPLTGRLMVFHPD